MLSVTPLLIAQADDVDFVLWLTLLLQSVGGILAMLSLPMMGWALYLWSRNDAGNYAWLLAILLLPFPIAPIYIAQSYLPNGRLATPVWLRRFTRKRELRRLEIAARQIGNPHQYVQWGDALRECSEWTAARNAYEQALARDPQHLPALWGLSLVMRQLSDWDSLQATCAQILQLDPQYKFGDPSVLYGAALVQRGDYAAAKTHFEQHLRRWRHPEAMYLLADCQSRLGEHAEAERLLENLLLDLDASPTAIARKHRQWRSKATQLLRRERQALKAMPL